jgi:hypothetical protein
MVNQTAIKYANIFQDPTLQNLTKLVFLVWKYTTYLATRAAFFNMVLANYSTLTWELKTLNNFAIFLHRLKIVKGLKAEHMRPNIKYL